MPVSFTAVVAVFSYTVGGILQTCAGKKMPVWIDAGRVVAPVKDAHSGRDWTNDQFVGNTVGQVDLPPKTDNSVAVLVFGFLPFPASRFHFYRSQPKSSLEFFRELRQRSYSRFHGVTMDLVRATRPHHTASSLALFSLNGRGVQP